MKIKVGVIFGGETVEHEVSIISALQAMNNLDEEKYEIIPIYISKDRIWYTGHVLREMNFYKNFEDEKKYAKEVTLYKKGKNFFLQKTNGLFRKDITDIDIILPVVHGNNVEDGTLAGLLDSIGVPYVGSHVLGSAIGQDKVVMKQVLSSVNIPVVDYTWFFDNEYLEDKDKIKVIYVSANKATVSRITQLTEDVKASTITPIGTSITNIANVKPKENFLIVNMEDKTTITAVVNQKVYNVDKLDEVEGIGEVRARTIKQSLRRMQEQFVFDNLMI